MKLVKSKLEGMREGGMVTREWRWHSKQTSRGEAGQAGPQHQRSPEHLPPSDNGNRSDRRGAISVTYTHTGQEAATSSQPDHRANLACQDRTKVTNGKSRCRAGFHSIHAESLFVLPKERRWVVREKDAQKKNEQEMEFCG